jgi:hypothetical protein
VRHLSDNQHPFFPIERHFSTLSDVRENVGADADFSATYGICFFAIYYKNFWKMVNEISIRGEVK